MDINKPQEETDSIENLQKKISELEITRKNFENANEILEAGKVNKKIISLRKKLSSLRQKSKQDALLMNKKNLSETFFIESEKFNSEWLQRKNKLLEDFQAEEKKLKEKYKEDKIKTKEELQNSIPSKPKPDPVYLHLKKSKEALIKQKQYEKAFEVDRKIKKLDVTKQEKWEDEKNEKIKLHLERLKINFQRDLQNFAKRKNLALFEFERNKAKEFDFIEKKYKNTVGDIALSQKTLKKRLMNSEKMIKALSPDPQPSFEQELTKEKEKSVEITAESTLSEKT